jgi:hypothetical protein
LKPSEALLLATGPSAGSFLTVNQIKAIAQEPLVARAAGLAGNPDLRRRCGCLSTERYESTRVELMFDLTIEFENRSGDLVVMGVAGRMGR